MFRKLLDLFKPQARPYGLSDPEYRELRAFWTADNKRALCDFLDTFSAFQAEIMLRTEDSSRLQFMRGYVAALRDLPTVVDNVTKEKSSERIGNTAGDDRAALAALYGTSAWG